MASLLAFMLVAAYPTFPGIQALLSSLRQSRAAVRRGFDRVAGGLLIALGIRLATTRR